MEFERQGNDGIEGFQRGNGGGNSGKMEGTLFEKLITVEDLSVAIGFAPQTIRNWVAMRKIPFVSIGGKTRFRQRSIEAWISSKEKKPWQ